MEEKMLGERRMANDNIYRYTIETIENYYPRIMKIKMANNLIRDGIATKTRKKQIKFLWVTKRIIIELLFV